MVRYVDSAMFVAGRLALAVAVVVAGLACWALIVGVAWAAVEYPWHVLPPVALVAVFVWCRTLDVSPRRPLLLAGLAVWAGVALAMFTGVGS